MHAVHLALRQFARQPRFSALAIVTIGLALGVTVGIGTIVDHAVLRPLPYPDANRLVVVWNTYPQWREREVLSRFWDRIDLSWPEYEALRENRSVFDEVAIFRADEAVFGGRGQPEVVLVGTATHSLLRVLHTMPAMGRWFAPDEDRQGGLPVAVIAHEFWQSSLGADPSVIGRSMVLDGERVSVIGVLPEGFRFRRFEEGRPADLWMPLGRVADPTNAGNHSFVSIARLRDGVSRTQAQSASLAILRGDLPPDRRGARLVSLEEYERSAARPVLLLFAGAVGVLLLLACATVATMQLTRVAERDREIAVRVALGASRGRIARQLLIENVVLGLAGGALGVLIAALTIGALLRLMPGGTPGLDAAGLDLRLLLLAGGLALVTGAVFGTAPLVRGARRDSAEALRGTRAARSGRTLLALVGAQSALAVLLLAGAALLVQTVRSLDAVDPGFEITQRLTFAIMLPEERYPTTRATEWFRELQSRIGALPGVTAVDATSILPLSGESSSNSIWLESAGPETGRAKPGAERRIVTPGYFATIGISVVSGRALAPTDGASSEPVIVVSRSAAERLWAGRDPIGDRVQMNTRWWTVVGVVDDVRDRTLAAEPVPTVYVSSEQWPRLSRSVIVRTAVPPLLILASARDIVRAMDPEVPVRDARSLDQVLTAAMQPERARAILLGSYAVLATLLALAGLYGVTSYLATQRTREIGIRLALGARLEDILRLVMHRTMAATFGGALVGTLLAFALTRLLRRFLYGVEPSDPAVLGAAVITLTVLATIASAVPAFTSARTSPTEALRSE